MSRMSLAASSRRRDEPGQPPASPAAADDPPPSPTCRAFQPSPLPPEQRVRRALAPDPHAYVAALAPALGPTARPSSLQLLAARGGRHAPSALCRPGLTLDATQLACLPVDRAGMLLGVQAGVAQCHLTLGTVKGVPRSGALRALPRRRAWAVCRCLQQLALPTGLLPLPPPQNSPCGIPVGCRDTGVPGARAPGTRVPV